MKANNTFKRIKNNIYLRKNIVSHCGFNPVDNISLYWVCFLDKLLSCFKNKNFF